MAATSNGIVRCNSSTPAKVEGLCTANLKVCVGLVLHHPPSGKASLSHLLTMVTDINQIVDGELKWFQEEAASLSAVIVTNQQLINSLPTDVLNCTNYLEELKSKLVACGITRISYMSSGNGLVVFRRNSHEVLVPVEPAEFREGLSIGKECPYFLLRSSISILPHYGRRSGDLQFDGQYWLHFSENNLGIFDAKDLQSFNANNRNIDTIISMLRSNSAFNRMRCIPGNFNHSQELENYHGITAHHICVYLDCIAEYKMFLRVYKMFSIDSDQRRLIERIGGTIASDMDRGMFKVEISSKYLIESTRKTLNMDRLRVKKSMSDLQNFCMTGVLAGVLGWRGEPDFDDPIHWSLITFPYSNEADRVTKRKLIAAAV